MSDQPKFRYIHYERASGAVRCLDCQTEFEQNERGNWVPQCECSHAEQVKPKRRRVCPSCNGTGIPTMEEFVSGVTDGWNCPTCDGDGQV